MELGLAGKVAVVTGASRGIGRAVVDELLTEGVLVVAGARDVTSLRGVADLCAVTVDLATPEGPGLLLDAAVSAHGGVDFVVNNLGDLRLHFGGFTSITDEDWMWAFQVNFMSTVRTIRAAIPHLIERHGVIVNIASLNGRSPAPGAPEYSAMKAAQLNLTRSLALELAPSGVRVNAVSPGPVLTDMQIGKGRIAEQVAAVTGGSVDQYVTGVNQSSPLGRFANPDEIASAVVLLLSERLGYVTGAEIAVDGAVQSG